MGNQNKNYTKYSESSKNNDEHVVSKELEETVLHAGGEVMRINQEPVTSEENENNDVVATPEVTTPEEETEPLTEVQTEPETEVQTEVETEPEQEIIPYLEATVVNCTKLNVRKEAAKDSEVVCVIAKGTELTVNLDASTDTFYKVYGVCKEVLFEGYCVKEFISIK